MSVRVLLIPWLLALVACVICAADRSMAAQSGEQPVRRLLIVYETESTLVAATEIARGLARRFGEREPTEIEFYTEYLDIVRFADPAHLRRLRDHLAAKYEDVALDVVLAAGPNALRFMLDNRERIAPGRPLVAGGIRTTSLGVMTEAADSYGVISRFDVERTLGLAIGLQPEARRIVVLTGSSGFDRSWQQTTEQALGSRYRGLDVQYLSGLTIEAFKAEAARLPSDTILLILTVYEDADGRNFVPRDAAAEIAAAAATPAYAVYSSYVGSGVVGGVVETFEGIGEDMAALAEQVMSGAPPAERFVRSTAIPVVDWRQLRRWGIDEQLLPDGAKLEFHAPTAWERYRLQILGALAIILLQTGTIAGLVVTHRRRRRIEQELAVGRLELAHLSRITQLGELSGSFAHELNQPLTSIMANAEAGTRLLDREPVDIGEIRDILNEIVEDDRRASGVIAQLRRLMLKGETKLDRLDLNEVVTATIALARSELVARQTKVDFRGAAQALAVRGNFAQLQQVVLNLTLNAAEAMAHLPRAERRIEIETRKRDDAFAELAVSDNGGGISAEMREAAFEPFVSTKAKGLGLGLAICRSIVLAHGGTLQFDETRDRGARVVLALPAA